MSETCGTCEGTGLIVLTIGTEPPLPLACSRCAGTGKTEAKDQGNG